MSDDVMPLNTETYNNRSATLKCTAWIDMIACPDALTIHSRNVWDPIDYARQRRQIIALFVF